MGKKVSLLDFSYTRPAKGHLHGFQKISGTGKALHHSHAQPGPCVLHERPFRHVMVGSDQVWNPGFLGSLFFLDFAKGEKRKIAYGPSMARHDKPSERYLRKISRLLKRFDPISVREQGMVDHLRQHFGCGQHLGHGPRIPAQPGAVA